MEAVDGFDNIFERSSTAVLNTNLNVVDSSVLTLIDNNLAKRSASTIHPLWHWNPKRKDTYLNTSSTSIVKTIVTSSNISVTLLKSIEIHGTN